MTDEEKIVKRIILTLEQEAKKLKKEISYKSVREADAFMNGFYRAVGVVKRFERKAEEEEESS